MKEDDLFDVRKFTNLFTILFMMRGRLVIEKCRR